MCDADAMGLGSGDPIRIGETKAHIAKNMGKPYTSELRQLSATLKWASEADLGTLRRIVSTTESLPLQAVGSGGSLTAAHLLATVHRRYAGHQASVLTPLEASTHSIDPDTSLWLLSAGGTNVDILTAFSSLVRAEPAQMVVLCGRRGSPLSKAAERHEFVDLVDAEGPAGKDGFLATNSLVAACTLLCRAYGELFNSPLLIPELQSLVDGTRERHGRLSSWKRAARDLWSRQTLVVLHGPATSAAAIDLESKFTEAALGNLQIADYRNFAHGRHHWLAKHGSTSGVIAFTTEGDRVLATKTLSLLPADIPVARLDFEGDFLQVSLAALLTALHIAGWAGEERRIDPGRPGVPPFGRRLFRLAVPRQKVSRKTAISESDAAAIERKTGVSTTRLEQRGDLLFWRQALGAYKRQLLRGRYAAVVFDYDGTLVDVRERAAPPRADLMKEVRRLLTGGLVIGVATGRGASVRRDLQGCLPKRLWSRVVIGYYNGAEVARLDCDSSPDGAPTPTADLQVVANALQTHSELRCVAKISPRPLQITVEPKAPVPENRLWDIVNQVVQLHGVSGVSVVRSSHSVDVLAPGVSKATVATRLQEWHFAGESVDILRIGDRGRWPGNDFVLLREPHSISVDEVSVDHATCWNLAPRGYRGVQLTLAYCQALRREANGVWRLLMPSWRGV